MEQMTASRDSGSSGLDLTKILDRAKAVLLDPKNIWSTIKSESATPKDLITGYLGVLLAAGAIAQFVRSVFLGISVMGVTVKSGLVDGLTYSVLSLILTIVGMYVMAAIMQKIAPKFEGSTTIDSTFRLLAYSTTASALGQILLILPVPGIMLATFALGLYGLYTLFQGITPMTGVPEARRVPFLLVSIVIGAVIMFVVNALVLSSFAPSSTSGLNINGQEIDMKKLEDAAKAFQNLAGQQ